MKLLDHKTLTHHLHQAGNDPYLSDTFRQALSQALMLVEHAPEILGHLAMSEFDFPTALSVAEDAGLKKHYAAAFLGSYSGYLRVDELYAEDDGFAAAINALIDDFEYPDWSRKTVGEVLEKYT